MSQHVPSPVDPARGSDLSGASDAVDVSGAGEADGALGSFSPATRAWFTAAFPGGPTCLQQRTWGAISRDENVLAVAPTGSGKTLAAFLCAIDRLARRGDTGHNDGGRASARPGGEGGGVRVLYVSPLKALGADVERNLRVPLAGIQAEAARLAQAGTDPAGGQAAAVTVGVRSGDTSPAERRRLRTRPPDVLITTPESLYLMLTSAARQTLSNVETVIVDEIHSLAGDKRGTHLAVSLERLDRLLERPAQRVGLSATVAPPEEVARFLGGCHPVTVVADDAPAVPDVTVSVPVADMARVPATPDRRERPRRATVGRGGDRAGRGTTTSIWPHIERAVLDQVLAHRTTLVFVSSRGACERLTARLNEAYASRVAGGAVPAEPVVHQEPQEAGTTQRALPPAPGAPVIARAHHGSVSKEQRLGVEHDLKAGRLRCVVATSSLELGIDMGSIDLVLQVSPPPSVASGLQRVGRADHRVGGRSRGVIYPVERTQLVDAAVTAEGMLSGAIERTGMVTDALDVLAQHTVAAACVEDLEADDWYATVRRSAPYADLPRSAFDSVLAMVSGGLTSADLTSVSPLLVHDRRTGRLTARPGAQRLAVTAPGTIPDRGVFPVVLPEGAQEAGRRRVGELDEEMVNESRPGDVITLGTSSWRVREITRDRVVVDPAPGRSARLPFWRGEGPGRPAATGAAKGAFLREATRALEDPDGPGDSDGGTERLLARLAEAGLDSAARDNLVSLLREQRAATGVVPCDTTLVLERYQEADGSWRLVLHSPYGRRVHEPWALGVRERARDLLGADPQVLVADDGIVLRVPPLQGRPPGPELVVLDPGGLSRLVRDQISTTALFAARFRECAARALLMPPARPGQRAPLWLQRLRASQLLEASQHLSGLPVVTEAARECLQDVYDLPALHDLMSRLAAGEVRVVEAPTRAPSPFARPLLLGYEAAFLYQDDLPLPERRTHLLSLDPRALAVLVGDEDLADLLDEAVVTEVDSELQRLALSHRVRADTEGVADLLRELGPLSTKEIAQRCAPAGSQDPSGEGSRDSGDSGQGGPVSQAAPAGAVRCAVATLAEARRAVALLLGGREVWVRAEDAPVLHEALGTDVPGWVLEQQCGLPGAPGDPGPQVPGQAGEPLPGAAAKTGRRVRTALEDLVLRRARTRCRTGARECAQHLGLEGQPGQDRVARALDHLEEEGLLVRLPGPGGTTWMAADVLDCVRRRSLARARAGVSPVPPQALQRLVTDRAGLLASRPHGHGQDRAGSPGEAAAGGVDALAQVLPALEGMWLPASLWESVVLPSRVSGYRPAMLDELVTSGEVVWQARGEQEHGAAAGAVEVAFFPTDSPLAPVPGPPLEADLSGQQRWQLLRQGRASASSFEPVRRWLAPAPAAPPRRVRSRRARARLQPGPAPAAAASVVAASSGSASSGGDGSREVVGSSWCYLRAAQVCPEEEAVVLVEDLLERYGVVCRETAAAGGLHGGLAPLHAVLRRMEDTGAVLRGQFVEGLGPVQFARQDAVEELRAVGACQDGAVGQGQAGLVVVDLKDPACLVGRGVPWPQPVLPPGMAEHETRLSRARLQAHPPRRQGARVVLREGEPVLSATQGLRTLVCYTDSSQTLDLAVRALVRWERDLLPGSPDPAGARHRVVVEQVNGVTARNRAVSQVLREAGLVQDPRGMRLRAADPRSRVPRAEQLR